jgi:hypothetical protein
MQQVADSITDKLTQVDQNMGVALTTLHTLAAHAHELEPAVLQKSVNGILSTCRDYV